MKQFLFTLTAFLYIFQGYGQQSENISFQHDGLTVNGVFTKPNGNGRFPVIIINPGTGANDKDGTIPLSGGNVACLYPGLLNQTLHPYKELGDALTQAGYAVLRYDKLEYTYTNAAMLSPITFHKLWLPVESAIDYVKTRMDADTAQIILIGHSEGSSLIPYIAKNKNDVKALISIGGPRQPLDSLLAYQLVYIAQTCGGDVTSAQSQATQILAYFDNIRNNNWNSSTPALLGVSAATWYDYIRVVDSVAINYNICNLPTLFIGMSLDINVPLTELVRLQNEVTVTHDFWSIPNLIHYMTPNNDPHVAHTLTDTVVYWLTQQNITGAPALPSTTDAPIHISPNPFDKDFTVAINLLHIKKLHIALRDNKGSLLFSDSFQNIQKGFSKQYKADSLPAGIYYIEINADELKQTQKMIKQ